MTKFSTQLEMGLTNDTLHSPTVPPFVQSLAMAAGSWTLRECSLDGAFDLDIVVGLLPATLEKLVLHLNPATTHKSSMSVFSRLTHLQHLAIDLGIPFDTVDCSKQAGFVLDTKLPCLQTLYMCTEPVTLLKGAYLSTLLPCIEHLAVHVIWRYAGPFVTLPSLRCLKIKLHATPVSLGNPPDTGRVWLNVYPEASLLRLKVIGPEVRSFKIHVAIAKHGVELSCDNVDHVVTERELALADCPFHCNLFSYNCYSLYW